MNKYRFITIAVPKTQLLAPSEVYVYVPPWDKLQVEEVRLL